MKILLIETEAAGHHISLYLNSIVDELILMNYKVSLLTFNNVSKLLFSNKIVGFHPIVVKNFTYISATMIV